MEKIFYQKHLPHYQPSEATFFVTYRLAGSLPLSAIQRLKDEFFYQTREIRLKVKDTKKQEEEIYNIQKLYFAKFDTCLHENLNEPYWLRDNSIAGIVAGSLHFLTKKSFTLWAYCIMPNHVHVLISLCRDAPTLYKVMQQHKSFTARECNRLLNRSGQFWTHESYDHVVRREEEFGRIIAYILNNPVKAGFVKNWQDWIHSYINSEL